MKRALLVLGTLGLVGCQGLGGLGQPPVPSPAVGAARATASFGGLRFGTLTSDGAQLLGSTSLGGNSQGNTPTAADAVVGNSSGGTSAPSRTPTPSVSYNGGIDSGVPSKGMPSPQMPSYYYGSYTYGPSAPMTLESVTEAAAPGFSGSLVTGLAGIVKPVLTDWAKDAALVSSMGNLDADGAATSWQLAYVSASQNESMIFLLAPGGSRVLFLRWKPVVLDLGQLQVDSAQAVKAVLAGVADPNFKTREETLGRDFFADVYAANGSSGSGVGYASGGTATSIAVPRTAVAPMPPVPAPSPSPMPYPSGSPVPSPSPTSTPLMPVYHQDPLYSVTPGGNWSAQLMPIGTYLVWQLSYNSSSYAMGMPYKEPVAGDSTSYTSSYVFAMVDARTGEVIRMVRPYRGTTTWVVYDGSSPAVGPDGAKTSN